MSKFENVSVVKQANVYFDGKVTSRSIHFSDGSMKTLGFMLPGEYRFNTGDRELMEIMSGKLDLQLAGSSEWRPITAGQSFDVPGASSFTVRVSEPTDYCCSFIK